MSDVQTNKPKKQRYYTRRVPCIYPRLTQPDTKFKAEGEYSVGIVVSPEYADALITKIKTEVETQAAELRKKDKRFAKYQPVYPVKDQTDKDTGDPTGAKIITFKQTAKVVREGKDDLVFDILLVDSKGKPITGAALSSLKIGSGSEVDISYNVRVVANNLQKNFSVKLQPLAVQVLKLVEWGGESFQFETDENGFEAPDEGAKESSGESNANGDF